jgi:hypothetical protein
MKKKIVFILFIFMFSTFLVFATPAKVFLEDLIGTWVLSPEYNEGKSYIDFTEYWVFTKVSETIGYIEIYNENGELIHKPTWERWGYMNDFLVTYEEGWVLWTVTPKRFEPKNFYFNNYYDEEFAMILHRIDGSTDKPDVVEDF